MANEPQSPISYFAAVLAQQPALKATGIPVYAWRKAQALNTQARRIVIYPSKSGLPNASKVPDGLCDVDQHMVAECWGYNGDVTWAIMSWLIQALESQSIGAAGEPGFWWELLGADWETNADTGTQGECVSVIFSVKFTISAVAYDVAHMGVWPTGRIDSTSQEITEP